MGAHCTVYNIPVPYLPVICRITSFSPPPMPAATFPGGIGLGLGGFPEAWPRSPLSRSLSIRFPAASCLLYLILSAAKFQSSTISLSLFALGTFARAYKVCGGGNFSNHFYSAQPASASLERERKHMVVVMSPKQQFAGAQNCKPNKVGPAGTDGLGYVGQGTGAILLVILGPKMLLMHSLSLSRSSSPRISFRAPRRRPGQFLLADIIKIQNSSWLQLHILVLFSLDTISSFHPLNIEGRPRPLSF